MVNFCGIEIDALTIDSQGRVKATNLRTRKSEIVQSEPIEVVLRKADAMRKIGYHNRAAKVLRDIVQECRDQGEIALDEFRFANKQE